MNLYAKFGEMRVRPTPISESAFLGAAVTAAMAGLRPVVELMMIDFVAVAADALVNQAAKLEAFSGGRWKSADGSARALWRWLWGRRAARANPLGMARDRCPV